MGCGSSKQAAQASDLNELAAKNAELQTQMRLMVQQQQEARISVLDEAVQQQQEARISVLDEAIVAHLARILQIPEEETVIKQYTAALRSEGCDAPEHFDDLTVDELREEPFNFKRLHLKRVAKSRGNNNAAAALPPVDADGRTNQANIRGQCSLCGLAVLDTHARIKDNTGMYQHQDCQSGASKAKSTTPRTSVIVAEHAIAEAKTKAAAAVEEAEAEVAAIVAAADVVRASVIASAKRDAAESLAAAQKDAEQIAAAAAAAAARATAHDTASAASAASAGSVSTQPLPSATLPRKPSLPAGPKTKPLLPGGKHAFLSYQWDVQENVKEIKGLLNERGVKCWMDIDGGMKADMYDSMAEGVAGAACVICFMTQAYQDSANCKLELKFAQQSGVPIIPVMI